MKKILFITPSKSIGGTNSALSSLINNIQDKYDIKVLLMSNSGNGTYHFIKHSITNNLLNAYHTDFSQLNTKFKFLALIIKCFKRFLNLFSKDLSKLIYQVAAKQIQKEYDFDIVIGFSEGYAMKLASEFDTKKKITWIHCEYDRAVPTDIDELQYYDKFHNIVCVSQYTLKKFVERYPTLKSKSLYIYNLIDFERIKILLQDSCSDLRFNDDLFTIVSVGRMDPVKQFSLIPKIAKSLTDLGTCFRWYIIGGPVNEEYKKVEVEIQKYGLEDYVIPLGNKVNPYPYMYAADLYVCTSLSEACPMVFIEAKMCGLPIVSSDFGSAYEFVGDGEDLVIVSLDHIATKIYTLTLNQKQSCELPNKFINGNFTVEETKSMIHNLLSI